MVWQVMVPGTQTLTLMKGVLTAVKVAAGGPASTVTVSTLFGVGGGVVKPPPPPPPEARNPSWIKARVTDLRTGLPRCRWRVPGGVARAITTPATCCCGRYDAIDSPSHYRSGP